MVLSTGYLESLGAVRNLRALALASTTADFGVCRLTSTQCHVRTYVQWLGLTDS